MPNLEKQTIEVMKHLKQRISNPAETSPYLESLLCQIEDGMLSVQHYYSTMEEKGLIIKSNKKQNKNATF